MALTPHTSVHREMEQAEQKAIEHGLAIAIGIDVATRYLAANGHQVAADLLNQVVFTLEPKQEAVPQ